MHKGQFPNTHLESYQLYNLGKVGYNYYFLNKKIIKNMFKVLGLITM